LTKARETSSLCPGRCLTFRAPPAALFNRRLHLYQGGQLDADGFGRFYKPLEERAKQLEADVPRLEAQIDIAKVNSLSTEEVASSAQDLSARWPKMPTDDKRRIVEMIVEEMKVGKGEIAITFCGSRPSEDMATRWRKGWDSNPR
jgi:site-specific DNA recombinase